MDMYIITGGSRGLGASFVRHLESTDAVVVSLSRTKPPGRCVHKPVDLSRPEILGEVMVSVFKETDLSEVSSVTLINNAGTLLPIGPVQGFEQGEIIFNTSVNFMAPIVLTSLFIREIQEFPGDKRVVNISSGAAMTAYEGWSLYCASKAGLEQFTRCVAKEQARLDAGVLIINFNPGVMDTDMQATIRETSDQQFPTRQRFVDLYKNQVLMDPDIVAACLIRGLEVGDLVSGETYGLADFNCLGPA